MVYLIVTEYIEGVRLTAYINNDDDIIHSS